MARDEDEPARDEAKAPGTSGGRAGTSGEAAWRLSISPGRTYAPVAIGTVATCAVNAASVPQDAARYGVNIAFWKPLVWEFTSGAMVLALMPLIRFGVVRSRRADMSLAQIVGLHVALLVAFFVVHVAGMVALRHLFYAAIGAGSYDFGFTAGNLLYEFRKDVLTYGLIAAVFWLAERQMDRVPAAAVTAAPAGGLWLKDGTISIRLDPADITWVASAGNYVEYALASGKRHLVRGTLQAEEERLKPNGLRRIHRQRLVNAARVRRVATRPSGDFDVELDTGETLAGSRRYRNAVEGL